MQMKISSSSESTQRIIFHQIQEAYSSAVVYLARENGMLAYLVSAIGDLLAYLEISYVTDRVRGGESPRVYRLSDAVC
jgi:hypothetical protein